MMFLLLALATFAGHLDCGEITRVMRHDPPDARVEVLDGFTSAVTVVEFTLRPTPESEIHCRLLLPPPAKWNGRFWGIGNTALGDSLDPLHITAFHLPRLNEGAATCEADMGTVNGRFGREVVRDFGWRSHHLMCVEAKKMIAEFYGRPAKRNYFYGVSSGGGQGLHEAQRFPEDYDGIVCYVPAHYRTRLASLGRTAYREGKRRDRKGFMNRVLNGPEAKNEYDMDDIEFSAFVETIREDVDASSTDLDAFVKRGGKLMIVSGLADRIVPTETARDYCEALEKRYGGIKEIDSFFRAYFLPGRGHTQAEREDGVEDVPSPAAMIDWVERGIAPEALEGTLKNGARRSIEPWRGTKLIFVGDSAAAGWRTKGATAWERTFVSGDYAAENLATDEMKAEDFAARVAKDGAGLDGRKALVLSIGTDDIGTGAEHGDRVVRAVFGVKHAIAAVMKRCPDAKVVLVPILPRGVTAADPVRQRLDLVNGGIDRYLSRMKYENLSVCFINRDLLDKEGNLRGVDAYDLLAAKLKPHLDWALGKAEKAPRRAPPGPTGTPRGASRADTPSLKDHWISDNFMPGKKNGKLDFRFEEKFAEAVKNDGRTYDVVMVGDSITHLFDVRGKSEWEKLNTEFSAFNLGFGGDHAENALWNILYGGFFDHVQGKVVTLMIGTNNRGETAEQVADGIKACVEAIKVRVPKATVFLHPMLPRIDPKNAGLRAKNDRTNELVKPLADGRKVIWVDLRPIFEGPDVTPERQKELLPDGTHPSVEGFRLWREKLTEVLRQYIN